jgi:hypothetical protein
MQHPSFPKFNLQSSPAELPDDYKLAISQFQYRTSKQFPLCIVSKVATLKASADTLEKYPDGYPGLAAFMDSSDSFGIYRKFGYCHARLLAIHMSNVTEIERKLLELDKQDEAGGGATNWRLRNRFHKDGLDKIKRDLQTDLERELLAYGIVSFPSFCLLQILIRAQAYIFPHIFRYLTGKVRSYQIHEPYPCQRPP